MCIFCNLKYIKPKKRVSKKIPSFLSTCLYLSELWQYNNSNLPVCIVKSVHYKNATIGKISRETPVIRKAPPQLLHIVRNFFTKLMKQRAELAIGQQMSIQSSV